MSITETHPHLVEQWDDERSITEFTAGSGYRAQWKCSHDHTWKAPIVRRTGKQRTGCPYCSGYKVLIGFNDLSTIHPEITDEWYDKRKSAQEVTAGSGYKAEWKCVKGHIWKSAVSDRSKRLRNCPYCSGSKVVSGFNDLKTTHPHLVTEWNDPNPITKYSAGSNYNAQWECPKGHQWQAAVFNRAKEESTGCPYCAGKKAIKGVSDLLTTHPELASEWNDERDITTVSAGSDYIAEWQCTKGHQWKDSIYSKVFYSKKCYICFGNPFVSTMEQEIYDYVKYISPDDLEVQQSNRSLIGRELDIYIPEKNFAIEFNGLYWHTEKQGKDKWYHYNKWKRSREQEIELMTIWEDDWKEHPETIKKMIRYKMGLSDSQAVGQKMTTNVDKVGDTEASVFYFENHLQGSTEGVHYGSRVQETNELIALSTWTEDRTNKGICLKTYAVSRAGQSEVETLLKQALMSFSEDKGLATAIASSDNDVSDETLYTKLGFTRGEEIEPEFSYVFRQKRVSHLKPRLEELRNEPKIQWEDDMTENQIAETNGIERIWGCGKTRWKKVINPHRQGESVEAD